DLLHTFSSSIIAENVYTENLTPSLNPPVSPSVYIISTVETTPITSNIRDAKRKTRFSFSLGNVSQNLVEHFRRVEHARHRRDSPGAIATK
ncbi:MAG: hypothetical protein WBL65_25735, partial [Bryobacteraceae bacterium]